MTTMELTQDIMNRAHAWDGMPRGLQIEAVPMGTTLNDMPPGFYRSEAHDTRGQMMEAAAVRPEKLGHPAQYMQAREHLLNILEQTQKGARFGKTRFLEALSSNDLNFVFQDIIQREVMDMYEVPDSPFSQFSKMKTCDLMERPVKMFGLEGLAGPMGFLHPGEPPDKVYPYDSQVLIRPYKYGRAIKLLWEVLIDDDLGVLKDLPKFLDQSFKTTEGILNTMTYADSGGFADVAQQDVFGTNNDKILDPALSSSAPSVSNTLLGNAQAGTAAHAELSLPGIEAAITQLAEQLSPRDEMPINVKGVYLVVGVGLETRAQNLLGALKFVTENPQQGGMSSANANAEGFIRNEFKAKALSGIRLVVDPYLHIVADAAKARQMWMLVADPEVNPRMTFASCKLRGYEKPIIERERPLWVSVTGNEQNTDWISTGFRQMIIHGTQWGDPRNVVASMGSG